jgi:hypothetical protein
MAITKLKLSESTDGKNIKVVATATAGTTIHTAHASSLDEIYIDACNTSTGALKLTIEWGGTTSPDDTIEQTLLPEDGWVRVIPGHVLTNSLLVKAFAGSANLIIINGYVHRIT